MNRRAEVREQEAMNRCVHLADPSGAERLTKKVGQTLGLGRW
jgi:hypothetical protein